jgi:hypothetical protein
MFGPVGSEPIGGFWDSLYAVTGQTLTPSRIDNTSVLYAPVVSVGALHVYTPFLENQSTFYSLTITTGPVTITPSLMQNTSAFFTPSVGRYVIPWVMHPNTSTWSNRTRSGNWVIHPIDWVDWTEQ